MSTYQQVAAGIAGSGKTPAPRTLVLPLGVFASEWAGKPQEAVVVGIRALAGADEETARSEAMKFAVEMHPNGEPDWVESYNDALLRWVVARGICDPNDVSKPSHLFPMAEDQIRFALTSAGVRYVFDAIERLIIETSPVYPEATDEQVAEISKLLAADPALSGLRGPERHRARRLLRYVLNEINTDEPS